MTAALTTAQILAVQELAVRTDDLALLTDAYAALGLDRRYAFQAVTDEERKRAMERCAIADRMLLAQSRDDVAMVARCRAALAGDEQAVASYRSAVEMEQLMGGVG